MKLCGVLVLVTLTFSTLPAAAQGPTDVALGNSFGCGLEAGNVRCWGSSSDGQCGVEEHGVAARSIAGLSDVDEIAAGYSYACARSGGEVRCWGDNAYRQLGPNASATVEHSTAPVVVSGLPPIAELGLGNFSACARAENGSVWCWGTGTRGQLGPRVQENSATPVQIPRVRNATRLFAGHNHFCALAARGRLVCWGANSSGQAGARRGRRSPPRVVRGTGTIQTVALGGDFSCVLNEDGGIRCWGEDFSNHGQGGRAHRPTRHPTISGVTAMALAGENMCVIAAGQPLCMGVNRRRELHVPTPEMGGVVIVPTAVPGVTGVTRIEMRDRVQCVASEAGPWRCWGWNRGSRNLVGVGSRENDVLTPAPLQW